MTVNKLIFHNSQNKVSMKTNKRFPDDGDAVCEEFEFSSRAKCALKMKIRK